MTATPMINEEQDKFNIVNLIKSKLSRNVGGIGLEVGAGYGTDLATAGLLHPATIAATGGWSVVGYGAANFTSGAAANWAAQRLRGEEDISWGELLSAGLGGIIPLFGQKMQGAKGIANIALQSGARTVLERQAAEGIDEQRWLTPRETLESALIGGAFGAGFKGTGDLIRHRTMKYDLTEADKLFPPEVVQELVRGGRILHTGKKVDPNFQPYLFVEQIQDTLDETNYSSMHWATPSLRPEGPYNFRKNQARPLSAEATTGVKVTRQVEKDFLNAGSEQTADLTEQFGIDLGPMNIHHKAFLRQLFESMNGLTKEFRDRSVRYYERALGFKIGYDIQNALAIPDAFHPRLHALINSRLSSNPWSWNLKGIEKKFNLTPDWKHYTEYGQRLKIYKEISNVIGDSIRQTKRLYAALSSRTDKLGKLSAEEYTNIGLDLIALNNKLKGLPSPHFMVKEAFAGIETGSDVINDILINAGKVDLTLPAFQRLNPKDLEIVAKAELIDETILREALLSKQNAATVYNTWKELIGVSRAEFNNLLHQLDPNDMIKSGMSIEDVDAHIRAGWADPRKAKSSLPLIDELEGEITDYTTQELLDMGYTITDIENARNANWNITDLDY